jgi:hypothetical protein
MMDEKKFEKLEGLEKELIVEELRQRYNQFRWEEDTRDKFIYSYIFFYLFFFAIFRFSIHHRALLSLLPGGGNINIQYSLIFLFLAVIGAFWLVSIISFKKTQRFEGRTIQDIERLSPYLADKMNSPIYKKLMGKNESSPLVFVVFLLNEVFFLLSIYFYNPPGVPYHRNILVYLNLFFVMGIIIYALIGQSKQSPVKELDQLNQF